MKNADKNPKKSNLLGGNSLGGAKSSSPNPFAGNAGGGKKHAENPFAPAASIKAQKPGGSGKGAKNAAQQVRMRKTGP